MTDEEYLAALQQIRLRSGRRPEALNQSRGVNMPLQLARGWAAGTAGLPGDIESLLRMVPLPTRGGAARANEQTVLPTSEEILPRIPGQDDSPAGRFFSGAGTLAGGAGVTNIGRGVNRVANLAGDKMVQAITRNPQATSVGVLQEAAQMSPLAAIVKPKGGNWLSDSVERATEGLRPRVPTHRDEALMLGGEWPAFVETQQGKAAMAQSDALNNWIDKKLTRYIRNEMGTPEDPVRALAERNVLHVSPEQLNYRLEAHGLYPRLGQQALAGSDAAKMWEGASDNAINVAQAGDYLKFMNDTEYAKTIEKNPWLKKVPPETKVYGTAESEMLADDLGFNHLIDELRNATAATSDLPAELRLKPEQLSRVSMPQAVELVHRINKWREAQAAAATRAAREGIPVHKEYPEGFRWLAAPDTLDPKSLKYVTDVGCEGGWCTQSEGMAQHYGSGGRQLYVLHDPEGNAVAQVAVKPSRLSPYDAWYQQQQVGSPEVQEFERYLNQNRDRLLDTKDAGRQGLEVWYEQWVRDTGRPLVQPAPEIVEIKGKFNKAPKAEHLPYVQDFVSSQDWGRIGDLQNTGLIDLKDPNGVLRALKDASPERNIDAAVENFNRAVEAQPDAPRFMTIEQLRDFLSPPAAPTGYSKGGVVKSLAEAVEKYLGREAAQTAAAAAAKEAPKEQRMLMGVYRGYAGEDPGEVVYHAGAEFKRPNPGLFTNPERAAVEQFQQFTGAPRLHTFEARPRRLGEDQDVYDTARRLGIYKPGVPASQYLEQGENAIFPEAAMMVEELRNQGLDALRLKDGMGKQPSLVALDPSVLRPAEKVFGTPQRRVADYYAQKRAAQTGEAPHVEMLLVDPFVGRQYGHGTMGSGKNPPMVTRARELKNEDVKSRTKLYAAGGAVNFDPDEIAQMAGEFTDQFTPGYAAGGLVKYDPNEIDTIVSKMKEAFHG